MFDQTFQRDYITLDGSVIDITDVSYTIDCYDNGNVVGTAIAKQLVFKTDSQLDFENTSYTYHCVLTEAGVDTTYNLGTFHTVESARDDTTGIVTVTAMDDMIRFNVPYGSALSYDDGTVTIRDVLEECCATCGVALATQTLANETFGVENNQFTDGQMVRDVIMAIAQISGTFAQIVNDELVFGLRGVAERAVMLPDTSYTKLDAKRLTHPINTVVIRNSQVEGENATMIKPGTSESDQNLLVIEDNPFAYTQDKRMALIQGLYDAVVDYGYIAFEATGLANPGLQCGDPVTLYDADDNLITSYVHRMVYASPAGLQSKIAALSVTKAAVQYQFTPDAVDLAKRTEIIVDKANGRITALAEAVQETSETAQAALDNAQTNATRIEQVADGLSIAVSKSGGANIIKGTAGRVGLDDWQSTGQTGYATTPDTTAGGMLIVGDGTAVASSLTQPVRLVVGKQYAYYLKYRTVTGDGSTFGITVAEQQPVLEASEDWAEVQGTFTAQTSTSDIVLESYLATFYVADLTLIEGAGVSVWTQAQNEVVTATMIVDDRGTTWARDGEAYIAHADNTQFEIRNRDQNRRIAYMDKDGAQFANTVIYDELTVRREADASHALRIIPVSDGAMFVINN